MLVRDEEERDIPAIHAVVTAAFGQRVEADLVDALREAASPFVSLVVEDAGSVVGHILFTPVSVTGHADLKVIGLAPLSVTPSHQREGIGSLLVHAGLARCRELGFVAAVVLGHADYYPRFGFLPAKGLGLGCEYDVPDDVFQAQELVPGSLRAVTGTARYHPAFGAA